MTERFFFNWILFDLMNASVEISRGIIIILYPLLAVAFFFYILFTD